MIKISPKKQTLTMFKAVTDTQLVIPFIDEGVKAGFPSPAQDYADTGIDLNVELIKNRASTFIARVDGNSMTGSLIFDGDVVIVDRSLEVRDGCKVIAIIEGEFVMKTIRMGEGVCYLVPENDEYQTITVTPEHQFMIWGVVTHVIHKLY